MIQKLSLPKDSCTIRTSLTEGFFFFFTLCYFFSLEKGKKKSAVFRFRAARALQPTHSFSTDQLHHCFKGSCSVFAENICCFVIVVFYFFLFFYHPDAAPESRYAFLLSILGTFSFSFFVLFFFILFPSASPSQITLMSHTLVFFFLSFFASRQKLEGDQEL